MNLSHPLELKLLLQRHGFSFSKSLGQNFLIDEHILDQIVAASGLNNDLCALEIGPGAGTLTQKLAMCAKQVVAVEIDKALIPVLNETMAGFDNFKLINADIMQVDLMQLVKEEFGSQPFIVVANLPYYITTPIVMNLLEYPPCPVTYTDGAKRGCRTDDRTKCRQRLRRFVRGRSIPHQPFPCLQSRTPLFYSPAKSILLCDPPRCFSFTGSICAG